LARSKSSAKSTKKSVLNRVIDFFITSPFHAYLVGGYVRDTILGIVPVDIDIVVEGDALKAARKFSKEIKGTLHQYKDFGTASISVNGQRIDLASARVEKYPEPAKLPHVYPSTINEDLNRRDFTINAIAMSISRENFGEIFDPFDGLGDIKKGVIRILHKNSFIDDPTRIFRALRYKNRFGFKLEKTTRQLLQEAVSKQLIQKLSGQRLLNELRLIYKEPTYEQVLRDLSELGVFKLKRKDFNVITKLGTMGFLYYLSAIKINALPISAEERKIVKDFHYLWKIISNLEKATKFSTFYRILHPMSDEVIDSISILRVNLKPKITLYRRLKKKKPFINGRDIKRFSRTSKKDFKRLLDRLWFMQLDGKITSRKDALAYVKKMK